MCELRCWNRRVINPAELLKALAATGTERCPGRTSHLDQSLVRPGYLACLDAETLFASLDLGVC